MSVFLGSSAQFSQATVDPEKIKLADIQFSAMAFTFNKLLQRCESKCLLHEYGESELTKGEQECIDRCVSKYIKANVIIGEHLQKQRMDPYNAMPEYRKVQDILASSVKS
ncbi:mitochondrial import inner membrane translocase subunit, putative [Candida dubliniensis CD36]|uniref:Mitochondrial import inner membrane translocase subunit n=1 Tax=Candida dubliniensis (strain CD36 / ATCC MYA-646 / CBS 7987 / NCPF 3949 / NRRL Y-17841) TaxID=573826 RepID=B9WFM5_CANDC|nr:mitochondrial import inner membrane translocase subunit, putative [Candida dubliniensis CD36]CAX42044.1 mitochondrial import inner membrane translocase subunit, putative [Candida dubliniensis CD36]